VIGAAFAAAGGSAGNRDAEAHLTAFPGPGSVTYGENIAYTATLANTLGSSTFTQVTFRQKVPVATIGTEIKTATLLTSTCGAQVQGDEAVCTVPNVPAGGTAVATLVWQVPTMSSQTGCTDCLETTGRWLIKEGKPTNLNEEFPTELVKTSLLGGEGTQEKLHAGSFEIAACNDPFAAGSLRTNRTVDLADPVSTTVCLPFVTGLGNATTIDETAGNARHSEVCIAASGQNCPTTIPADFTPGSVTFVFRVADAALPKGYKITQLSHSGNPPLKEGQCDATGDCVVSIKLDNKTKIWTLVATSKTNGYWDW